MASAVVEAFLGISGLTLTVDLYPLGSDTAGASGITMTEATNRKGLYTGTTTAALVGEHQVFMKSGSTVVGLGYVWMTDDTAVHRIVDAAAVDAKSGTSVNVGSWLGTVITTAVPNTASVTVTTNNDKTAYSLSQAFPSNFSSLGIGASGHILIVDTLTTYTNDTPQTGDAFGRLGVAGVGLTNIGDTRMAKLDQNISTILTTAMTEAYAAKGATMTLAQFAYFMQSFLTNFAVAGTTYTTKKLDGTTTAATGTLDSSTIPTQNLRAT